MAGLYFMPFPIFNILIINYAFFHIGCFLSDNDTVFETALYPGPDHHRAINCNEDREYYS